MFTCSRKPFYFGGALLSPYEPMDGAHLFFFADFVCMLSVKEGHFTCFQKFFFYIFLFLRHPIANKANMKDGGSEMPAKRKMRKERRKDEPKQKKC